MPRRYDSGGMNHEFATAEYYYRKQYFEVLDSLVGELNRRFQNNSSFKMMEHIEQLLIKSCNGEIVSPSEEFFTMYKSDFQLERLSIQLKMLPDLLRAANEKQNLGIKTVTSLCTIIDLINDGLSKSLLCEVDKLIRLYLTVPMTTATAEKTFSSLRRIKSYLQTTMTQKRLNHTMLMHAHKQRTDSLNITEIAQAFVNTNDRRMSYFGKF